ncbi:MAG: sigma-70 family RNA polymerase sigma factor [Planctomycetales bacterium]|nr:sigma-70 family RNA polymerase sigma factor [Planctomycetales bacterium]
MLSEQDQLAVVRGLRDGHRDAWARLYDGYSVDIWRYVARLMGPQAADVADVVQTTMIEAARSARQFDAERGTLWSWLAGIAHHQAALSWRQAGRSARLKQLAETGAGELRRWLDDSELSDKSCEQLELADLVRGVLSELSGEYAALLTAKYLDDRSLEEMAQQFGGSVDAIKSKLARARREFRLKFAEPSDLQMKRSLPQRG